jgi:hypothetical protein
LSTYDELLGTSARIADAAIEWDMQILGWWKSDEGWVSDLTVAPTSTYVLDFTGMYVRVIGEDGLAHHREEFAPTADIDFRAIWRGWYERIFDLFRPWQGLPDDTAFHPSLDAISNAISVLNVATSVSGDSVDEVATLESANEDLDSALTSFCGEIIAMSGAMDTFAIAYSNRLPGVIRGQMAILGMLGCTLAAEQNLFTELRKDIAKVADDVLEVMQDKNSGGAATALGILGAVLAGASLFFTGGASATAIANGRTIVGILTPLVPKDEAPNPAQETFGGSDPMDVYDNAVQFLDDVKQAVADEEQVVRSSLRGAQRVVTGEKADGYDLSRRPALLNISDTEIIDVNPDTLAFLGGVIVPFVAENLAVAREQAAAAPEQSAWERDGSIGLGASGPYTDWENLYDVFIDVSIGTKRTLNDIGQKLIDVARLYVAVDEIVAQRERELQGELDVPEFS